MFEVYANKEKYAEERCYCTTKIKDHTNPMLKACARIFPFRMCRCCLIAVISGNRYPEILEKYLITKKEKGN